MYDEIEHGDSLSSGGGGEGGSENGSGGQKAIPKRPRKTTSERRDVLFLSTAVVRTTFDFELIRERTVIRHFKVYVRG